MAGFFGLFDYSKAGPGVGKEEPKKHRIFLFFDIYFRKFWKLCTLNLLYIACCIPIVTIGAATAGFTYVLRNFAREEHSFLASDFFERAKKNWKQGTLVFFINIFVFLALFTAFNFYSNSGFIVNSLIKTIVTAFLFLASIIYIFMQYYIYLILVTFNVTMKQLFKNSFIFAVLGLWRNILITLIILILSISMFFGPISIILGLVIFVSTCGFIINFTVYPIIKKYMIDPVVETQEEEQDVKEQIFTDTTKKDK